MKPETTDDRVVRLLRGLPREEASPSFTAAVLRRLEARPARPGPVRRLALAASAAVVLAAGVFGVDRYFEKRTEERQRREALARLETLESEKQALEREIRSLRRIARDARPVVYLGSTPELDVVVDLNRLASRGETASPVRFAHDRSQGEHRR